jgi:hypothetical protein
MHAFYGNMLRIQKFNTIHLKALGNRMEIMAKAYWERERSFLLKQCMQKKTKHRQALWKRLNLIDNSVKEAIIRVYLFRCLIRYKIRFLEWRLDFKLGQATDAQVKNFNA